MFLLLFFFYSPGESVPPEAQLLPLQQKMHQANFGNILIKSRQFKFAILNHIQYSSMPEVILVMQCMLNSISCSDVLEF